MDNSQRSGHAAMLLFSVVIAGSFILGAEVANMVEPAAINALRFFIASIVIGTYLLINPKIKKADMALLVKAPWRYILLGGIFASYFIAMFEGLKTASPTNTSVVFTLTPIMTAALGYFILKQKVTLRMAVALAIGSLGVVWVIFRGDLALFLAFDIGRGEAIFFVGCVAHAFYIPLARKLNWGEKPLVSTFGVLVCGFVFLAAVGFNSIIATDWLNLPTIFWATLLYVALFASAITIFLLQYAGLLLPSAKVMAYTYLTPIWVILLEGMLGHSWPPLVTLLGVGATTIALFLLLKNEHESV